MYETQDCQELLLKQPKRGTCLSTKPQSLITKMELAEDGLEQDFHSIFTPSLPILKPIEELLPLPELLPLSSDDEFAPVPSVPIALSVSTPQPISTPEPIPSPDPEPLPSPQPEPKPDPKPQPVLSLPEIDILEEISKYITDFGFEVDNHEFEGIESFDYQTLEEIGAINF